MSDESDQAWLILISRFLRFPYEKFFDELRSSTENCVTSASSAALFEVRNVPLVQRCPSSNPMREHRNNRTHEEVVVGGGATPHG